MTVDAIGQKRTLTKPDLTTTNRTMRALSYGICSPNDLLEKLRLDAAKLIDIPAPYDIYNFIVTAAVLAEWGGNITERVRRRVNFLRQHEIGIG